MKRDAILQNTVNVFKILIKWGTNILKYVQKIKDTFSEKHLI